LVPGFHVLFGVSDFSLCKLFLNSHTNQIPSGIVMSMLVGFMERFHILAAATKNVVSQEAQD